VAKINNRYSDRHIETINTVEVRVCRVEHGNPIEISLDQFKIDNSRNPAKYSPRRLTLLMMSEQELIDLIPDHIKHRIAEEEVEKCGVEIEHQFYNSSGERISTTNTLHFKQGKET
jgi:hypothetical protein